MQYFNIQVASQLSGVASATIRAWEKRYNAVVPERGDNKHRLYSEKDIEKLALLFRLTEIGQSIGKIAHLELDELKKVFSTLMHTPYDEKSMTPHHDKVDFAEILNNLGFALASYKVDILAHELEKACRILPPRELCLKVIVPLFQEIGLKVERQQLNISQEHTLSALASFYIGKMIGVHYQKMAKSESLVLIATPEGELHEIGILAATLLFVQYNIKFIFLGANLPAESIAQAANALRCKTILLGTTRPHLKEGQGLLQYLREMQSHLLVNTDVWIGGDLPSPLRLELQQRKFSTFTTLQALDTFLSGH